MINWGQRRRSIQFTLGALLAGLGGALDADADEDTHDNKEKNTKDDNPDHYRQKNSDEISHSKDGNLILPMV